MSSFIPPAPSITTSSNPVYGTRLQSITFPLLNTYLPSQRPITPPLLLPLPYCCATTNSNNKTPNNNNNNNNPPENFTTPPQPSNFPPPTNPEATEQQMQQTLPAAQTEITNNEKVTGSAEQNFGFVANDKMGIAFTCNVCETRISKMIRRSSYEKGVVLIQCSGCKK